MKNIYKIEHDGIYSSIEEISAIHSWSGDKIKCDDFEYFSTKAKAKKYLLDQFRNSMEDIKCAIERIKKS